MSNSLAENLYVLGGKMADNLVSMGVTDASADDGLTTLAGRILDIEPSTNIDLDIDCTLSASSASITVGESVTLTATLLASYDASPASLKTGEITGATILFKDEGVTVGTGYTDNNGSCSVTLSNLSAGSHSLKAVFEGTVNFDSAESSTVSVEVVAFDSISLTSTKDVLSYADSDSCTVTAQLMNAGSSAFVEGETVGFKVYKVSDDSLLETLQSQSTDSSGKCTVQYDSHGYGDIYIKAECMSLIQTYSLYDYLFAPTLDSSTSFYQISGSTSISNGEMSGGSARLLSAWDNTGDWELTFDGKKSDSNCGFWLIDPSDTTRDNNCVKLVNASVPYTYVNGSDTHNYGDLGTLSNNTYYSYTITKQNGVLKIKRSGSSTELTVNWSLLSSLTSMAIGVDTWGHTATIKDIVVKPL